MDSQVEALRRDRKLLLAEANKARTDGDERRALALYRRVLLEEPRNVTVALRVAPLLARQGEGFEAWQLFRMASQELMRARRREECLAALREACLYVPGEFEAWRLRADVELRLGRDDAAYQTLMEGSAVFSRPHTRAQAIALLERARTIEPWDPEAAFQLARLYARTHQRDGALELLAHLTVHLEGKKLRRALALQGRISRRPRYAWLWLRSAILDSLGGTKPVAVDFVPPKRPAEPTRAESTMPLIETLALDATVDAWPAGETPRVTH